jgi:hypothetical protein
MYCAACNIKYFCRNKSQQAGNTIYKGKLKPRSKRRTVIRAKDGI